MKTTKTNQTIKTINLKQLDTVTGGWAQSSWNQSSWNQGSNWSANNWSWNKA